MSNKEKNTIKTFYKIRTKISISAIIEILMILKGIKNNRNTFIMIDIIMLDIEKDKNHKVIEMIITMIFSSSQKLLHLIDRIDGIQVF